MDTTTILRISRSYWQQTPRESGVYLLLGEVAGDLTVYVGMSTTDMRARVYQHHVTPEKNWFGTLYAVPLNVALVQGVEAALIRLFNDAGFARVANKSGELRWAEAESIGVSAVMAALEPWLEVLLGSDVVYGVEISDAVDVRTSASRPTWTREQWLTWIDSSGPTGMRVRMEELMDHWTAVGRRLSFGNGVSSAGLFPVMDYAHGHYWCFGVYDRTVEVVFQWLARRPVTDELGVRQELADRLNAIDGVDIRFDQLDRRPSFPVDVLLEATTGRQMLATEEWLMSLVAASTTVDGVG